MSCPLVWVGSRSDWGSVVQFLAKQDSLPYVASVHPAMRKWPQENDTFHGSLGNVLGYVIIRGSLV